MIISTRTSVTPMGDEEARDQLTAAVERLQLRGKRVLLIIPDGTRSGPVGRLVQMLSELAFPDSTGLDILIALGTHQPMDIPAVQQRLGLSPERWERFSARVGVFNHEWWNPATFYTAGVIPAAEIARLSHGLMRQDVPVTLNRKILDYDQLIICGPVLPHEVVGFSGGSKYFFPGISGQEVINFTHWLGALIGSYVIIGTKDTPVRAVIERAASYVSVPAVAVCFVAEGDNLVGLHIGSPSDAWDRAADQAAQVHITYLDHPMQRVLSIMPPMYTDIWTAAKGMYKTEPIVADDGVVVIYAPQITEFSYTHGDVLEKVGYHVRDYFVKQWDEFKDYPTGVLAHSTHLRGMGEYDAETGTERPRIHVTLATGISRERCARANVSYLDPASIRIEDWEDREDAGVLLVPKAGERLFRLQSDAAASNPSAFSERVPK